MENLTHFFLHISVLLLSSNESSSLSLRLSLWTQITDVQHRRSLRAFPPEKRNESLQAAGSESQIWSRDTGNTARYLGDLLHCKHLSPDLSPARSGVGSKRQEGQRRRLRGWSGAGRKGTESLERSWRGGGDEDRPLHLILRAFGCVCVCASMA